MDILRDLEKMERVRRAKPVMEPEKTLKEHFEEFESKLSDQFARVGDSVIEALRPDGEACQNNMEERIIQLEQKIDGLASADSMKELQDHVDSKFNRLETEFRTKLDGLETKLEKLVLQGTDLKEMIEPCVQVMASFKQQQIDQANKLDAIDSQLSTVCRGIEYLGRLGRSVTTTISFRQQAIHKSVTKGGKVVVGKLDRIKRQIDRSEVTNSEQHMASQENIEDIRRGSEAVGQAVQESLSAILAILSHTRMIPTLANRADLHQRAQQLADNFAFHLGIETSKHLRSSNLRLNQSTLRLKMDIEAMLKTHESNFTKIGQDVSAIPEALKQLCFDDILVAVEEKLEPLLRKESFKATISELSQSISERVLAEAKNSMFTAEQGKKLEHSITNGFASTLSSASFSDLSIILESRHRELKGQLSLDLRINMSKMQHLVQCMGVLVSRLGNRQDVNLQAILTSVSNTHSCLQTSLLLSPSQMMKLLNDSMSSLKKELEGDEGKLLKTALFISGNQELNGMEERIMGKLDGTIANLIKAETFKSTMESFNKEILAGLEKKLEEADRKFLTTEGFASMVEELQGMEDRIVDRLEGDDGKLLKARVFLTASEKFDEVEHLLLQSLENKQDKFLTAGSFTSTMSMFDGMEQRIIERIEAAGGTISKAESICSAVEKMNGIEQRLVEASIAYINELKEGIKNDSEQASKSGQAVWKVFNEEVKKIAEGFHLKLDDIARALVISDQRTSSFQTSTEAKLLHLKGKIDSDLPMLSAGLDSINNTTSLLPQQGVRILHAIRDHENASDARFDRTNHYINHSLSRVCRVIMERFTETWQAVDDCYDSLNADFLAYGSRWTQTLVDENQHTWNNVAQVERQLQLFSRHTNEVTPTRVDIEAVKELLGLLCVKLEAHLQRHEPTQSGSASDDTAGPPPPPPIPANDKDVPTSSGTPRASRALSPKRPVSSSAELGTNKRLREDNNNILDPSTNLAPFQSMSTVLALADSQPSSQSNVAPVPSTRTWKTVMIGPPARAKQAASLLLSNSCLSPGIIKLIEEKGTKAARELSAKMNNARPTCCWMSYHSQDTTWEHVQSIPTGRSNADIEKKMAWWVEKWIDPTTECPMCAHRRSQGDQEVLCVYFTDEVRVRAFM